MQQIGETANVLFDSRDSNRVDDLQRLTQTDCTRVVGGAADLETLGSPREVVIPNWRNAGGTEERAPSTLRLIQRQISEGNRLINNSRRNLGVAHLSDELIIQMPPEEIGVEPGDLGHMS